MSGDVAPHQINEWDVLIQIRIKAYKDLCDLYSIGGFPIEITTKINYHIICCYHYLMKS